VPASSEEFFQAIKPFMFWSPMNNFEKSADCPASQQLLAFQRGELAPRDAIDVERHVIECEFCESEVEMYTNCPPPMAEDFSAPPASEIPPALYELAEALLEKKYADFSLLERLLNENEKIAN
jgi:hypothetical protein